MGRRSMSGSTPHRLRRAAAAFALVFVPLHVSWGLGTAHPGLDALAVPAATLAGVPSLLGVPGALAVLALAVVRSRFSRLSIPVDFLGIWGALAFLGPALAATRPLPWVPLAVALVWWVRRRSMPPTEAWHVGDRARGVVGALLWFAASRVRPFGPGLLPAAFEDRLAAAFDVLPDWLETAPMLLLAGAGLMSRRKGYRQTASSSSQ